METRAHFVASGLCPGVSFLAFFAVLWLGRAEFAQETKDTTYTSGISSRAE